MSTIGLNAMKEELTREILNETDANIVRKLMVFFKNVKAPISTPPCQFTVEEIKSIAANAVKDAKLGLGKSVEELRVMHPRI
jgi:hypothetical protein